MSKLTTTWWIIFYKDQLLLKKTDNGFSIPCAGQPPIHISPETNIHEICMLDGHPCKAIAIDYPVEESDKYMMTGLRASYDFIPSNIRLPEKQPKYYTGIAIVVSAPHAAQQWSKKHLS